MCIEAGLADINDDCSSDEEQQEPEDFTQTLECTTVWNNWEEVNTTLPLLLENIHNYFVTTRLKRNNVTASKPFEKGYRIFHECKVKSVAVHHVSTDLYYTVVRAIVMTTQRRDQMYKTQSTRILAKYCMAIAHVLQESALHATM